MNKYYYSLYGLIVSSEIEIKELISIGEETSCDVKITLKEMPTKIKEEIDSGKFSNLDKDESWFTVKNIGIYRMINGNSIEIEVNTSNKKDIICFLLGSAFGILLIQRNNIAIHGSTVDVNNKVFIFTGESGAGKSSLSAGCISKGYNFLSDDVSVLELYKDKAFVNPAYPQQKICDDIMKELALDTTKYVKLDENRCKYAVPKRENFYCEKKELYGIIEIVPKEHIEKVNIKEVIGMDKIKYFYKNIYRIECAYSIGIKGEYLNNIIKLSNKVRFYILERPKDKFTVNEQIDKILELW